MQLVHLDIKATTPNDANTTVSLTHLLHFCKNSCSVSSDHFCYHETRKPENNTKVGRLQCSTRTQCWIRAFNLLDAQGPSSLHLLLWSDAMKEPEKCPMWAGYPGSQDKSYCGLHFGPPEILLKGNLLWDWRKKKNHFFFLKKSCKNSQHSFRGQRVEITAG